jgi:glycogen debranching enzyme
MGPNFQYAIFGRDSIETAEDLLLTHRQLAHDVILTLCRLQGVQTNSTSEEEPGKIHHEYRVTHLDGFTIPESSQQILHNLQQVWGGQGTDQMIYYGTHDATPLFIRLVGQYAKAHGTDILHETYTGRDGQSKTVQDSLLAAVGWLVGKIQAHPLGLFAYKRLNPLGIANQDWKDSATSHIHADGSMPNFDDGIASIELQGYAYDALKTVVRLSLGSQEERHLWSTLAHHLQQQTIASCWMYDEQYFAQGIDLDGRSQPRQIASVTSDAGALLDSDLLYDLPEHEAGYYAKSVARMLFSPELLTTIGIRCRAVRYWDLVDFIDYHGPNTVWPKETFDIAKGLHRAGLHHLAAELEHRLMVSLERAGEFYEFFYVSRIGKIWYDHNEALAHFSAESPGHFIPMPEPGQAWTIAAAVHMAAAMHPRKPLGTPTDFEQSLLATITKP